MKIPEWFLQNHYSIITNLHLISDIKDYTINHDCGKHLVKIIDNNKIHYPNHSESSYNYWLKFQPEKIIVGNLILNDMFFHTCSSDELDNTLLSKKDLCTLLLVSLAELHANAEMFGGIESISFKSKYKQIDRRGKKLCKKFFPEDHKYVYVFIRNDLSDAQKAVQAGHSLIEISKKFDLQSHPSLIYLIVKSEFKLKKVIQELIDNNINFSLFREESKNNEITAVATEPVSDFQRNLFKRYSLL